MPLSDPQEFLSDFKLYPWYNALLAAPHITPEATASRNPPYPNPIHAHTLFSSTLFAPTGLRAMQSFHARAAFAPSTSESFVLPSSLSQFRGGRSHSCTDDRSLDKPLSDRLSDEWLVVVSLGTGLNGPGGIVHGGLAMTLLDSTMAVRAFRAAGEKSVVTTRFEAEFKRKIQAPCVVLCRAWLDDRIVNVGKHGDRYKDKGNGYDGKDKDGEAIYTRGTVGDGMGNVYLEATARFAQRRELTKAKL